MQGHNNQVWFPAKKNGSRWKMPFTWQGWAVLISYILLLVAGSIALTSSLIDKVFFRAMLIVLTVLFVWICWKKGERAARSRGNAE